MVKTEAPAYAKAAGNSYSLHLPLARLSSTLHTDPAVSSPSHTGTPNIYQTGERISTWYQIGGVTVGMVYPDDGVPRATWVEDVPFTPGGDPVPIRWALADGFEERCYVDIHGHCEGEYEGLSARIPTSPTTLEYAVGGVVGKVTLEWNDHLAAAEFEKRCEVLWRAHR